MNLVLEIVLFCVFLLSLDFINRIKILKGVFHDENYQVC
jgi:hypothetical protein